MCIKHTHTCGCGFGCGGTVPQGAVLGACAAAGAAAVQKGKTGEGANAGAVQKRTSGASAGAGAVQK